MSISKMEDGSNSDVEALMADIALGSDVAPDSPIHNAPAFPFWCQRCREIREGSCPQHGKPSIVYDRPIQSRAMASLPAGVLVKSVSDAGESYKTGGTFQVFAKKIFPANAVFGPFIAPKTDKPVDSKLELMVEKEGKLSYLDYTDQNECNWMMFVGAADKWTDINLMVYESNSQLYFVTTKYVQSDQEFRVAYSTPYANNYGLETITPEAKSYECEVCGQTFKSHIGKMGHQRSAKCKVAVSKHGKARKKLIKDRPPKPLQSTPESELLKTEQNQATSTESKLVGKNKSKNKLECSRRSRVSCPICHVEFDQTELMQLHMVGHKEEGEQHNPLEQAADLQRHSCPACSTSFADLLSLLNHVNCEHKKRQRKKVVNMDGASEHDLVIDIDEKDGTKANAVDSLEVTDNGDPSGAATCTLCNKRLKSAGALSAHMRSHLMPKQSYYGCFLCEKKFSSSRSVLEHVKTHAEDGFYRCPKCPHRLYDSWKKCRKHINSLHSGNEFPCTLCDKKFSRADKYRLHMLTHTDIKEFMCDQCGKQFNRKDKLLSHMKKLHGEQTTAPTSVSPPRSYHSQLPLTDYHKYVFKCRDCTRGFKRRGMLINHVVKAHPDVPISSIPELNIPLLRTQRDFYCNHCNKTYKSSTKRKMHILKNHPGTVVPPGLKSKEFPGRNTYSQEVGNIPTLPYSCESCHKQYANKAKLTEHRRKKHSDVYLSANRSAVAADSAMTEHSALANSDVVALIQPLDTGANDSIGISLHNLSQTERVDNTDLLTQAMSVNELQPSIDFPNQSNVLASGSVQVGPLEFRILPNSGIDLSGIQLNNSALSFTTSNTSLASTQPIQQSALSHISDTPNLNSVASHVSPRTTWPYQFKLT